MHLYTRNLNRVSKQQSRQSPNNTSLATKWSIQTSSTPCASHVCSAAMRAKQWAKQSQTGISESISQSQYFHIIAWLSQVVFHSDRKRLGTTSKYFFCRRSHKCVLKHVCFLPWWNYICVAPPCAPICPLSLLGSPWKASSFIQWLYVLHYMSLVMWLFL